MGQKKGRFESVEFSNAPVELWTPSLEIGSGFTCSRGEFRTFWTKGRIEREVRSHIGRCWILRHNAYLAGYITLLADKLTMRRQLLRAENVRYTTFPAVKIGLLAADERAKGAGSRLVEWAMLYTAEVLSVNMGVRFLTVDALYDPDSGYDTSPFYARFGFALTHPHQKSPTTRAYKEMFLDLKPLIDLFHPL